MPPTRARTTWAAVLAAATLTRSAAAQSSPEVTPAPGADWVQLTLAADDPKASVYAREPRRVTVGDEVAESWTLVCPAPCNQRLDPRLTYRVLGEGIVPSVEFNLAPGSGRVALAAQATHRSTRSAGAGLAITAAAVAGASLLLLLLDFVERGAADAVAASSPDAQSQLVARATTYEDLGLGLAAGAAVLGATSLFFLLTGKTQLTPIAPDAPSRAATLRLSPAGLAF